VSYHVCINAMPLAQVSSSKFLGVLIDPNLTWNLHIKHISSKIASGVGILYKCKKLMPRAALLNIYYSLIYSHLYYCCILWGTASKTLLKPLQSLQNKALRNIFNLPFRTSTSPLYKSLSLLKVYDLAHYCPAKQECRICKFVKIELDAVSASIHSATSLYKARTPYVTIN
jgi:hypothetical protein